MQEPILTCLSEYERSNLAYAHNYVYKIYYEHDLSTLYIGSTDTSIMTRLRQHQNDTGYSAKAKWIQEHRDRKLRIERIARAHTSMRAREIEYIAIVAYREAGYTLMNQRMPLRNFSVPSEWYQL